MVVKVQLSLSSTFPERQVLIYNRSRSVVFQGPASRELQEQMGQESKAFYRAEVRKGQISLKEQVPEEEW